MSDETIETTEAPRRGRPPRQEVEQEQRRRRQPGSLNRMVASPLAIPEECKDPAYHYHWVNDVRGRVRALTTQDDYDVVTMDELEEMAHRNRATPDLNRDSFAGNGNTVSLPVDTTKSGQEVRAILLKKRQSFYQADYEEGLAQRQAMMEGRVYEGEMASDAVATEGFSPREDLSSRTSYVPKGNSLPPMRRKGPITTRSL